MQEYDKIRQFILPYISQANEPGLKSRVVSTDRYGTRNTFRNGARINRETFASPGVIFVGGSVCFGWGATCDETTIPGYLSNMLDVDSLNLGLMAGNSEMEAIASLPYAGDDKNYFVSITGNNTLSNCILNILGDSRVWGSLYEPMMPFNEEFWELLLSNDILANRGMVDAGFDPSRIFKTSEDKLRYQKLERRRLRKLMLKRFGLGSFWRRGKFVESTFSEDSIQRAVEIAVTHQTRSMKNLYNLTRGRVLFVVQPFMFSDKI